MHDLSIGLAVVFWLLIIFMGVRLTIDKGFSPWLTWICLVILGLIEGLPFFLHL